MFIKFKDFDKLEIGLDEAILRNRPFVQDVLMQLATALINLIIKRVPINTGAYARSWRIMNQTGNKITVASTADPKLFVLLEFSGAKAHLERPIDREAMRFVVGGQEIFATLVQHPGARSQPHLRPAMQELSGSAKGIVYSAMARHFPTIYKDGKRVAAQHGVTERVPPRQVGRSNVDVTANIGRGTKGKITAQLTSRKGFKKRIRIRGTRRVGTGEFKKAGFQTGGLKKRGVESTFA